MKTAFYEELAALAQKHNLIVLNECSYCQHTKEDCDEDETHYFITLVKKRKTKQKAAK